MGKPAIDAQELGTAVEAVLAANGDATPWVLFVGTFNIAMWSGAAATVKLQCSFDGGTTALDCTNLGALVTLPANCREQVMSREPGVMHRLVRTSAVGPCTARLSQ